MHTTERRNISYGTKNDFIRFAWRLCLPRLEEKKDFHISTACIRHCRLVVPFVQQGAGDGGYAARSGNWSGAVTLRVCHSGKNRIRRWGDADGQRYFPGICCKSGAASRFLVFVRNSGIVFYRNQKEREEVSNTLYSVSACGVFVCSDMKDREWKASVTVEASIYIPLLIGLYLFAMRAGIQFYTEAEETVAQIQAEEQIDVLKLFYRKENIGDIIEHGN